MEQQSGQRWLKWTVRAGIYGLLTIALVLVAANPLRARLFVQDWWRLQNYQPTESVASIAERIQLSDEARVIFYASQPQLLDKQQFSQQCPNQEEANVLGCYVGTSNIYILDVQEEPIEEIEEVTAAHELLHGVWARMSNSEQKRLGRLLQQTFDDQADDRLRSLIDGYRQSNTHNDPDLIPNELHSILATEVSALPEELENHYQKYFKDRQQVIDLYRSYADEFQRRQDRIEDIQQQLSNLKASIEQKNNQFESLVAENEQVVAEIQRLRESGQTEESNALVPRQNQLVAQINNLADELNRLVSQHNQLVEENNQLALQLNQLSSSLDSKRYNTQ